MSRGESFAGWLAYRDAATISCLRCLNFCQYFAFGGVSRRGAVRKSLVGLPLTGTVQGLINLSQWQV